MTSNPIVHHDTGISSQPQNDTVKRNAELALEISRLRSKLNQSDHEVNYSRLTSTVERQAAEIEALTRLLETHSAARYVTTLEHERDNLKAHVAELEFQLQHMLSSSSWRLTRPMRAAAGIVSKVLRLR